MNPQRRPSDESSTGQPAPRAQNAGDGDDNVGMPLRTFASRSSRRAPSFQATEDAGAEAFPFPPLEDDNSTTPSTWRNPSTQGQPPDPSQDGPGIYRTQSRNPSIRIRRRSNASLRAPSQRGSVTESTFGDGDGDGDDDQPAHQTAQTAYQGGRLRSVSQPERGSARSDPSSLARHSRAVPQAAMPRLTEEGARPTAEDLGLSATPRERPLSPTTSLPEEPTQNNPRHSGKMRRVSRFFWPGGRNDGADPPQDGNGRRNDEYHDGLVDYLDIVDPEVQTLSTLTNIQNSLFVPDLGYWVNRRPTYVLSDIDAASMKPKPPDEESRIGVAEREKEAAADAATDVEPPPIERSNTITSRLTESHYAALPHGTTLEGWSAAEKWELDDHVRHILHSRRARFKRTMKGFGQYVRRPLGFLVTLYATLITLFGLAWVLFLIGWIYVGEKQVYAIHIIDSVLVALFAIVGDGLAPFRAIDTYRLIHIWRYTRIVENADRGKLPKQRCKIRRKGMSPEDRETLGRQRSSDTSRAPVDAPRPARTRRTSEDIAPDEDPPPPLARDASNKTNDDNDDNDDKSNSNTNDAPSPDEQEDPKPDPSLWPLTPSQQKKLVHHQTKLAKSHSFYKPHETGTHFAFPLGYLIAIVILLDCHSCLQISLGATTWGIDYHTRPIAITTVILCVSITCNITAGLVITVGDRKTRKKDVHRLMNRRELTTDAIRKIDKKRVKEGKEPLNEDIGGGGVSGGSSAKTSRDWGARSLRTKLAKDWSGSGRGSAERTP